MRLLLIILLFCSWGVPTGRGEYRYQKDMIFGMPFDNGRIEDYSGLGKPYMEGTPYYDRGAWYFDGSGDAIKCQNKAAYNLTNFTISFWAKLNTTANAALKGVVAMENTAGTNVSWLVHYDNANFPDAYSLFLAGHTGTSPFLNSDVSVTNLNWNHIAYTYKPNEFRKYLNGQLIATYNITFGIQTSTKPLIIGSGRLTTQAWDGALKYVFGWSRCFNQREIFDLWKEQVNNVK